MIPGLQCHLSASMTPRSLSSPKYLTLSFHVSYILFSSPAAWTLGPQSNTSGNSGPILTNSLHIVGSAAYNSTITNHTEVLPVSVDIIGMPSSIFLQLQTLVARYLLYPSFFYVDANFAASSCSRMRWRDLQPRGGAAESRDRDHPVGWTDHYWWGDSG